MLQKISPAQPLFLVLLRHGDLKSGLLENSTGSEISPGMRLAGEFNGARRQQGAGNTRVGKLLACGRGGRGIQCGLIILLLRCLNKGMVRQNAYINNCIPLLPSYVRYRTDWTSADHIVTFPGGRGVKISWACSAGWCRFPDTYGRECRKLTLPRSIADTATIWELAGLSWVMPWESLKRYSLLKLSTVQK